jgi:ABC-2 type transport system permease protein
MSTLAYTVGDSTTMLRRNLRRLRRYPSLTLLLVGMPIVFLLLFVYVFGGQLSHGLDTAYAAGRSGHAGYLHYVTPGILLMTVAAAVQGTAIVVAMDMTGGIIDRFRTMAIARSAVLTGHVLASLIQTLLSIGIVLGVAVALGFRPTACPLEWLAAIGVLTLFSFALIWLATALGLAAKSVETASNTPMFLTLLPFLGSGFVLIASMPAGLSQFARYQPFTPTTETLRGLLTGTPIGTNALVAVAWSVGIALASYLWARHLYTHRRALTEGHPASDPSRAPRSLCAPPVAPPRGPMGPRSGAGVGCHAPISVEKVVPALQAGPRLSRRRSSDATQSKPPWEPLPQRLEETRPVEHLMQFGVESLGHIRDSRIHDRKQKPPIYGGFRSG